MSIFKKKPKYSIKVCGEAMIADFYVDEKNMKGCYLHIHAPNGVFEQKVTGFPFGYLLTAVTQGDESEVENYCIMLWRITQEIYQESGFANDIIRALNKRYRRLMKQAESNAKSVTRELEQAEEVFMEEVINLTDASPKERKRMRKQWRQDVKETIEESGLTLADNNE